MHKPYDYQNLYEEIKKEDNKFTATVDKHPITIKLIKNFVNDIYNRKINKDNIVNEYKNRISNTENTLKRRKGKNIDAIKDYIYKIKESAFGPDQLDLGRMMDEDSRSSVATPRDMPLLEESVSGLDQFVRHSKNLEGKTYILGRDNGLYISTFNNNYEKIIDQYLGESIGYQLIKNKLNEVNDGIKIYEEDPRVYKNDPHIENEVNNSKEYAKGLEKIIAEIDNNKIRIDKETDKKDV